MLTHGHTGIDPSWIPFDSQSTISVFQVADMIKIIWPSKHVLRALTNGDFQESNLVSSFPNLGEVWFNPNSTIANILSLSHISKVCRVTMDTTDELCMILVHRSDGTHMNIREHACGLYVFSPTPAANDVPLPNHTFLSTVQEQNKLFTPATSPRLTQHANCIGSSVVPAKPSS